MCCLASFVAPGVASLRWCEHYLFLASKNRKWFWHLSILFLDAVQVAVAAIIDVMALSKDILRQSWHSLHIVNVQLQERFSVSMLLLVCLLKFPKYYHLQYKAIWNQMHNPILTYFLFFITKYAITRTTTIKMMPAATPIPIYTENENKTKKITWQFENFNGNIHCNWQGGVR